MKKKLSFIFFLFILVFNLNTDAQLKGDPWIFKAYQELYMRPPMAAELTIQNYNGGSWNSYDQLKVFISNYQTNLRNQGVSIASTILSNGQAVEIIKRDGRAIAIALISQDGGSIVASGAGNIVASGAGNIVTNATGNFQGLKGIYFGPADTRVVQGSGQAVIKTSGNGALIIK